MDGALWYLKRCDLFEQLTPEQGDRLNRHARVRKFKRHAIIYAPAEPGQTVMVLAEGRVKIKDITPDGKETILTFIEEGEMFGELALLDDDARQEYAEAVTDCRVLMLPREEILWLMESGPVLALSLTRLIGTRRRRIEGRLRNILFLPSRERLIRLLLELQESHGQRSVNRCEIRLPLSHQDIAGLIGLTRETVTVVLGQLQRDGLIAVQRKHITVTDCRRLAFLGSGSPTEAVPNLPPPRRPPPKEPRQV